MAAQRFLGELELLVLLALLRLGEDAYGVSLANELRRVTGREVSLGSIYAVLERLEGKALVLGRLGDPSPQRGGRAKRHFRVTKKGLRALKESQASLVRLWTGIPALEGHA